MNNFSTSNVFTATNYLQPHNESQRIVDYFCVVGLPPQLTRETALSDDAYSNRQLFYPDQEPGRNYTTQDPIVDIVVLNKSLNEFVPSGFECLWLTKAGHSANLNHSDAVFKTNHEMFICFRRGTDKPPITDIGIYYEGHERVMSGCQVILKTVGGNSANVNNSSFSGDRIFVTYRRSNEMACNALAVVEICVIIKSKGEQAPHTFNEIPKNLNRGLFGASVYLCYKKAWIPAPQIKYLPTTQYRYPATDHADLNFPTEVAMFGLPMGAVIESWPLQPTVIDSSTLPRPTFSTFVLNVTSENGAISEKVYGASIMFYEHFSHTKLDSAQASILNYSPTNSQLHANKCLLLLSRHALFEAFRDFLMFLYTKYTRSFSLDEIIPLEKYLIHLIYEVPFPTHQKPRVLVNLTDQDADCLSINLPDECILPQSAASFIDLLKNFGTDNSINVFLFVLLQRNVMVHSLRRVVLTGVVEALSCIIFPFLWRYSYLPMCPLNLCQLIEAPGSFILGMDSRFFDLFDPPENVICVDLDTNTISWTPDRESINQKILPKRPLTVLKDRLTQLYKEIENLTAANKDPSKPLTEQEQRYRRRRIRELELAIREAFLRFMVSIMHNYKQFLRTVTRRPNQTALDRNLATFFDCEGFVRSKEPSSRVFFQELIKTQLFYDCVMNLSFATELDQSLIDSFAFFSECCSRSIRDDERFLELYEPASSTVVILPPTLDNQNLFDTSTDLSILASEFNTKDFIFIATSDFVYNNIVASKPNKTFPRLKQELGLKPTTYNPAAIVDHSSVKNSSQNLAEKDLSLNSSTQGLDSQSVSSASNQQQAIRRMKVPNTPVGVRTNAEKNQSQRKIELILNSKQFSTTNSAKQNEKSRFSAAKTRVICLLSNSYALWFMYLAEHLRLCEENRKIGLNYAYQVLVQMQNHGLGQPDEICFRTMMQMCLFYKQPTLAVKTLLHMKLYKIELTPITYSYYNMALIDPSNWPSFEQDRWAKVRLTWTVICRFKTNLRLKREREEDEERIRRAKSKKKRKSNRRSSLQQPTDSNRRKSSTIKNRSMIKKLPDNESPDISVHFRALDSPSVKRASQESGNAKSRKELTNIYCINEINSTKGKLFSEEEKNKEKLWKIDLEKFQKALNEEKKLAPYQFDLINAKTGLLFLTQKKNYNSTPVKSFGRFLASTRSESCLEFDTDPSDKENFNKVITALKMQPVRNDPLNAFAMNTIDECLKQNQIEEDEINKRLFDYKPFEKEENSKTIPQDNKQIESDFVFEKIEDPLIHNVIKEESYQPSLETTPEDIHSRSQDTEDNSSYYDTDEDEEDDELGGDSSYGQSDDSYDSHDDLDRLAVRSNDSVRSINGSTQSGSAISAIDISHQSGETVSLKSGHFLSPPNKQVSSNSNSSAAGTGGGLFETPNPVANKLSMFMKRMETSIEMSGKLKGQVSKFLSEKSNELKDAMITSGVSPQEVVTSKLRSFSNYQINPGQYLNGLVKSNSTYSNSTNNSHSATVKTKGGSSETPTSSFQRKLFEKQKTVTELFESAKLDLDAFPDDDSYKALSVKWWGLEQSGDAKKVVSEAELEAKKKFLVDVQMSSCNICEGCKFFLYDEEIMAGWSLNDSDLNVKCVHCSALLVPKLFITIKDLETIYKFAQENYLLNPEKLNTNLHPFNDIDPIKFEDSTSTSYEKPIDIRLSNLEFSVEYLSPLVVRKEIENIILNKSKDDETLIDAQFMLKHKVIFWNLTWYFKRIGVDGCYLLDNLLNSRLERVRQVLADHGYKLNNNPPTFLTGFQTKVSQPFGQHSRVKLTVLWDNVKLKNKTDNYEIPLYLSWLNATNLKINTASITKELERRLVTVLSDADLSELRESSTNSRSLTKIFDVILRNVKEGEVGVPIKNLLRERTPTRLNFSSIYRELLYMLLTSLERYLIDVDAFDSEYRKAYKRILHNPLSQDLLRLADVPPNNVAVWSRRLFSPLAL